MYLVFLFNTLILMVLLAKVTNLASGSLIVGLVPITAPSDTFFPSCYPFHLYKSSPAMASIRHFFRELSLCSFALMTPPSAMSFSRICYSCLHFSRVSTFLASLCLPTREFLLPLALMLCFSHTTALYSPAAPELALHGSLMLIHAQIPYV